MSEFRIIEDPDMPPDTIMLLGMSVEELLWKQARGEDVTPYVVVLKLGEGVKEEASGGEKVKHG